MRNIYLQGRTITVNNSKSTIFCHSPKKSEDLAQVELAAIVAHEKIMLIE